MTPQQKFDRFDPDTAWGGYYPLGSNPWNSGKVAHLYRRAAFGASAQTVADGVELSPSVAVAKLLRGAARTRDFDDEYRTLREEVVRSGDPQQFKGLFLHRMLYSPHPLQERMTLFWHNHFATSNAKVNNLVLMQRQQDVIRKHALGHFGEMLQEMTRDPAMIIWLDANTNKKGRPNENYAREVFELFSLGVGNYTEKDIQEAARALTGWDVRNGRPVFNPSQHDAGKKTIFGRTGNWTSGDVIRMALEQPACARFLVRKIFRELVSETVEPSDRMLEPLVKEYRLRNYDTGWLVGRILRSWVFYSSAAIGQKVKPPVDFLVGTVRMLEGRASVLHLADLADSLSQSLLYPPSVKGWDGGSDWINSTTLLKRQNAMFEFTRGTGALRACDPARLVRRNKIRGDEAMVKFFLRLFIQQPEHESRSRIVAHLRESRQRLRTQLFTDTAIAQQLAREAAHLVGTLPEYQLM